MERRLIGVDMKDAIYRGIKGIFPKAQHVYCIRHLKQRDEMQILKIMDRKKCVEREKITTKKEIRLYIYKQRRGALYEYGLAEWLDKTGFCGKPNSLQQKQENRCKGFFHWFCGNCKQKFINSVICSAGDGSNADVFFYQNNIKSQNFIKKVQQNFEKKSLQATIRNFQT